MLSTKSNNPEYADETKRAKRQLFSTKRAKWRLFLTKSNSAEYAGERSVVEIKEWRLTMEIDERQFVGFSPDLTRG
ncbi:hypothetical protein PanWU01x14_117770 [Parasponia andersonii]|uniref:Uncharacterized protein n=1 Tax=Parasponia andersonii TaxID=3476 RepID=A0A2P5CW38_PARAD|nr:hypothetical protein PanWU01x14_117770 [Parasponia andersonii]